MEENFRRVPPPPPPRPNIPKPPVSVPKEEILTETPKVETMDKETKKEKKSLSPKLKLALLVVASVVCFAGAIVCGYFLFS